MQTRELKQRQGAAVTATGTRRRYPLLPVLLAGGAAALAAAPAPAVQLGDIEVRSALGQPLRASIAGTAR